jgi:hypothetical protein
MMNTNNNNNNTNSRTSRLTATSGTFRSVAWDDLSTIDFQDATPFHGAMSRLHGIEQHALRATPNQRLPDQHLPIYFHWNRLTYGQWHIRKSGRYYRDDRTDSDNSSDESECSERTMDGPVSSSDDDELPPLEEFPEGTYFPAYVDNVDGDYIFQAEEEGVDTSLLSIYRASPRPHPFAPVDEGDKYHQVKKPVISRKPNPHIWARYRALLLHLRDARRKRCYRRGVNERSYIAAMMHKHLSERLSRGVVESVQESVSALAAQDDLDEHSPLRTTDIFENLALWDLNEAREGAYQLGLYEGPNFCDHYHGIFIAIAESTRDRRNAELHYAIATGLWAAEVKLRLDARGEVQAGKDDDPFREFMDLKDYAHGFGSNTKPHPLIPGETEGNTLTRAAKKVKDYITGYSVVATVGSTWSNAMSFAGLDKEMTPTDRVMSWVIKFATLATARDLQEFVKILIASLADYAGPIIVRFGDLLKSVFVQPTKEAVVQGSSDSDIPVESLWSCLVSLMYSVIGLEDAPNPVLDKMRADRLRNGLTVVTTVAAAVKLFKWVFTEAYDYLYLAVYGSTGTRLTPMTGYALKEQFNELASRASHLLSNISKLSDSPQLMDLANKWVADAENYVNRAAFFGDTALHNTSSRIMPIVIKIKTALRAAVETPKARARPVVIVMNGPPGTGKSVLLKHLSAGVLAALFGTEGAARFSHVEPVFHKANGSQYWDGYHGQFATCLDDFGQNLDEQVRTQENSDLIRMANDAPFHLDMSAVEDKSNVYFSSGAVFVSTNLKRLDVNANMADHRALGRRVDGYVEILQRGSSWRDYKFTLNDKPVDMVQLIGFITSKYLGSLQQSLHITSDVEDLCNAVKGAANNTDEYVDFGSAMDSYMAAVAKVKQEPAVEVQSSTALKAVPFKDFTKNLAEFREEVTFGDGTLGTHSTASYRATRKDKAKDEAEVEAVQEEAPELETDITPGVAIQRWVFMRRIWGSFKDLLQGTVAVAVEVAPAAACAGILFYELITLRFQWLSLRLDQTIATVASDHHSYLASAFKVAGAVTLSILAWKLLAYGISMLSVPAPVPEVEVNGRYSKPDAPKIPRSHKPVRGAVQADDRTTLEIAAHRLSNAMINFSIRHAKIGYPAGLVNLNACHIKNNCFVTADHFFGLARSFEDGAYDHLEVNPNDKDWFIEVTIGNVTYSYSFEQITLTRLFKDDIAFFRLPESFPARQSTYHLWMSDDDLNHDRSFGYLFAKNAEGEMVCTQYTNGHDARSDSTNLCYMVDGKKREQKVTTVSGFRYDAPTHGGCCGAVGAVANPHMQRKLMFVHVGKLAHSKLGVVLTREMINEVIGDEIGVVEARLPKLGPAVVEVEEVPAGHAVFISNRTAMQPSIFSGPYIASGGAQTRLPAQLDWFTNSGGQREHPLDRALERFTQVQEIDDGPRTRQLLDLAAASLLDTLPDPGSSLPLTEEENLNGHPTDEHIKPVDLSTSGGYGYTGTGRGKHSFVAVINGIKYMGPKLRNDVARLEELILSGPDDVLDGEVIFSAFLKDELRSITKVLNGDTRLGWVATFPFLYLFRKWFARPMANMCRVHGKHWSAVGINPTSATEWTALYHYLRLEPDKSGRSVYRCWDSDAQNYDGSFSPMIHEVAAKIILEWVGDKDKTAFKIRKALLRTLGGAKVCIGKHFLFIKGKNFTGHPITALYNTIVRNLLGRYAWADVSNLLFFGGVGSDVRPFSEYNELVRASDFGDDDVTSASEEVEWYNAVSVAQSLGHIGFVMTGADKKLVSSPSQEPETITFLKRRFVRDTASVYIKGPLDEDSLINSVLWVNKRGDQQTLTFQVATAALREWALHSRQKFNEVKRFMNNVLRNHSWRLIDLEYSEVIHAWMGYKYGITAPVKLAPIPERPVVQVGGQMVIGEDVASEPIVQQLGVSEETVLVDSVRPEAGDDVAIQASDPYDEPNVPPELGREYQVASYTWNIADTQGTIKGNLVFPDVLFSQPKVAATLSQWRYFRGDVEVIVRVNATAMNAGTLMCSYARDTTTTDATVQYLPYSGTFGDYVVVSATTAPTVVFRLRYHAPYPWIDLKALYTGRIGVVWTHVVNGLSTGSTSSVGGVGVAMYARFVNYCVAGPTLDTFALLKGVVQAKGRKNQQPPPEQATKSKEGVVSGVANRVSEVTAGIMDVPVLGALAAPILGPINLISSAIGGIAGAFGFDKPLSLQATMPMRPEIASDHATGDGLANATQLALLSANRVADDVTTLGEPVDNNVFANYMAHPVLLDANRFPITTLEDAVFAVYPLSPNVGHGGFGATSLNYYGAPTRTAHVAQFFEYWRGSLKIRLQFVSNPFTTFRVRAAVHPQNATIPSTITTSDGDLNSVLIDVRGDTVFDLLVPYLNGTPWTTTGRIIPAAGSSTYWSSLPLQTMGFLTLSLDGTVVSTNSSIGTVGFNVFMSAGPDLVFARPRAFPVSSTWASVLPTTTQEREAQQGSIDAFELVVARSRSQAQDTRTQPRKTVQVAGFRGKQPDYGAADGQSQVQVLGQASGSVPEQFKTVEFKSFVRLDMKMVEGESMGENITNWRDLLHRYTRNGSIAGIVPASTTAGLAVWTPYTVNPQGSMTNIVRAFRWWRGTMLFRGVFTPGTVVGGNETRQSGNAYAVIMPPSQYSGLDLPANTSLIDYDGAAVTDLSINPVLSVSCPYYVNARFSPMTNAVPGGYTTYNEAITTDQIQFMRFGTSTGTQNASQLSVYVAAGDDFSLIDPVYPGLLIHQ